MVCVVGGCTEQNYLAMTQKQFSEFMVLSGHVGYSDALYYYTYNRKQSPSEWHSVTSSEQAD